MIPFLSPRSVPTVRERSSTQMPQVATPPRTQTHGHGRPSSYRPRPQSTPLRPCSRSGWAWRCSSSPSSASPPSSSSTCPGPAPAHRCPGTRRGCGPCRAHAGQPSPPKYQESASTDYHSDHAINHSNEFFWGGRGAVGSCHPPVVILLCTTCPHKLSVLSIRSHGCTCPESFSAESVFFSPKS